MDEVLKCLFWFGVGAAVYGWCRRLAARDARKPTHPDSDGRDGVVSPWPAVDDLRATVREDQDRARTLEARVRRLEESPGPGGGKDDRDMWGNEG